MKISLTDLRPNPYRDLARYPIVRQKVESLKASIRSTGFWDNVLVRKAEDGAHYELAYGHHRLEALKELVREEIIEKDYQLDVPVRKIDDATMIRIMANENVEEFKVTAEIIDETVRVTREFIMKETRTPMQEITASDISQFLGGCWTEDKVEVALQRLSLFDRGTLQREQLKGLSHTAARSIQREVARIEKTMVRDELERLESDDEEVTEQERKRVRAQVQKVANHVAQVLSDHIRNGGTMGEAKEKSIEAQIEMLPEDEEQRRLSTIDAAARAVNAKDFERKVEMLMRYRDHMSEEARSELEGKLRDLGAWCKQMVETLGS
ncbi:MAG TPA: ParB/RepB/Spo0J family partition protein [Planctomycetota bacterium]|nr:ParB/RepB/Spo0J family partition protein [Planctomycetota bacterium]